MLQHKFVLLGSLERSSLLGLESCLPHTGKGHSMKDWVLSSVTASHFSIGLMNHFQFLKESEKSSLSHLHLECSSLVFI